jgi:hypothetical protein
LTGKIEKWQHQQPKVVTPSVFLGNFDTGGEGGIPQDQIQKSQQN